MPETPQPMVVTMRWEGVTDALLAEIIRYVVMSRGHEGCRNIDLCASVTTDGRVVVIEKWSSPETQQAHLDSEAMVALALAAREMGAGRPELDLLEGISAYDLT